MNLWWNVIWWKNYTMKYKMKRMSLLRWNSLQMKRLKNFNLRIWTIRFTTYLRNSSSMGCSGSWWAQLIRVPTITSITLLNRNDEPGYAKQNNLLPNKWINVYFGGEVPMVITGEITNLEGDMIEIKTYPTGDIIYLNFMWKLLFKWLLETS